jgi:D-galactose 1-dehydrogenase/L-arabinose 1- dehydrogenase
MLEKPPAASLIDLAAITQAAHAAEVSLFASWHAREAPGVAVARDWLAGRSIEAIRVRWLEDIRIWHPGQEWILTSVGLGVFDPGINAFSILTALLRPRIEVVHAELVRPAGHDAALSARIGAISGGTVIDIELDFLHDGPPCWDIDIVSNGAVLRLTDGGHHISIDGVAQPLAATHEYAMLYRRFAHLIEQGVSDVDAAPLRLVEDIMAVAQWRDGGAFAWDAGAARASAAIAGRAPA